MADYKLASDGGVIRKSDGAKIPPSTNNRDYRAFMKWNADGGVPDPAALPPVIDKEDQAEQLLVAKPEMNALIKVLATRFSISPRTLLDEIRTQAKGA